MEKETRLAAMGVNLDFIFFLSEPIDYNNTAPTAVLQTDKTLVAPNENVTFIGTNSYDDGRVDQYFYDFGDGANSGWTTLTLFNHTYSTVGTYTASSESHRRLQLDKPEHCHKHNNCPKSNTPKRRNES